MKTNAEETVAEVEAAAETSEQSDDRADRQRAFDELLATQRGNAVGLAYHLTGDAEEAKDLAQEAFLKAHRALPRFRGDAKLSTWFFRILVTQAASFMRRRWVRQRWTALWRGSTDAADLALSASPGPEVEAGDPGLRRRIGAALASLPEGQRVAFALVHLEGMTITEAAAIMERAPGTVKSHLHRALRSLRQQLSDVWEA